MVHGLLVQRWHSGNMKIDLLDVEHPGHAMRAVAPRQIVVTLADVNRFKRYMKRKFPRLVGEVLDSHECNA